MVMKDIEMKYANFHPLTRAVARFLDDAALEAGGLDPDALHRLPDDFDLDQSPIGWFVVQGALTREVPHAKFALFDLEGKAVMQWQDRLAFLYLDADPAALLALPGDFDINQSTDGWYVIDGALSRVAPPAPPPLPPTDAQVLAQRDALLAEATLRIAPLQDAVDLDEATVEEAALLRKWKKYRVDLSRIEQQAGFPAAVQWPAMPA
jgi:hypothetical protein